MQVYFVYAPEDETFVDRLSTDLRNGGFEIALAPSNTTLESAANTDAIIVPLSEASSTNTEFIEQLASITKSRAQTIVLRIGTIHETPDVLRGILPLDFSDTDGYTDALQTLLEDLEPPTVKIEQVYILPDSIEQRLESPIPEERMRAIQRISDTRTLFDKEQLQLAERVLRDLAFKDQNANVKQLARVTLQLLSTPTDDEQDTLEIVTQGSPRDTLPDDATPIIIRPQKIVGTQTQLLVFSQHWWLLPIAGVLLALTNAIYLEAALGAIPVGIVWLVLPWFNVVIRDGGRFDWKMPGPIVGNALIGAILGLVGTIIVVALGSVNGLDALAFIGSSIIYGVLIGWMSTFHLPT